jgi:hypothetical protein
MVLKIFIWEIQIQKNLDLVHHAPPRAVGLLPGPGALKNLQMYVRRSFLCRAEHSYRI